MDRGPSAAYIANVILDKGLAHLQEAVRLCACAASLQLLCKRLQVLLCCVMTAKHAIGLQRVIDETDFSQEKDEPSVWHVRAVERLLKAQEYILGEIDNMTELISLLEG